MKRLKFNRHVSILCVLILFCNIIGSMFVYRNAFAEEEKAYVEPTDIYVTTPTINEAQDAVSFSLENLTAEDKKLTVSIKSNENGALKGVNEYSMNLKTGTEKKQITLPAKKGDVISIYDEKGNYYVKSLEIIAQKWIATWASAQQSLDSKRSEYPPAPGLKNNTFRQLVRISKGGTQIRLKFSNEYGKTPLVLNSVHIAKPTGIGTSAVDTATDTIVTFNGGSESVSIPAGKIMTSDLIPFNAKNLERIAVSTYFGDVPGFVTSHTGARTTSYLATGNHVADASVAAVKKVEIWYFLTGIDVMAEEDSKAIVCLGDSITDGRGVTTNYDNRWTDILANRLQADASTANRTVLNEGIGGNAIFGGLGPAVTNRYKRDVLDQLGVGYAIIFEAINDIGYTNDPKVADKIIDQYKKFAEQAHAKGIKVYGATITPFGGSDYYDATNGEVREQIRQKINEWIRNNKDYDGVIDFDAAIRDEANPTKIASKYNGDNLHPNAEGYKKLGESIDLSLFKK